MSATGPTARGPTATGPTATGPSATGPVATGTARLRRVTAAVGDGLSGGNLVERAAIAFALGLGVARVASGVVETLFPRLFLRLVGRPDSATPGAAVGFRMKGGRDLAIGLATLAAATNGDRAGVANMTALGVVIDGVDGLAVARDRGASLVGPVARLGSVLGYAVAVGAGVATVVLRRDPSRDR